MRRLSPAALALGLAAALVPAVAAGAAPLTVSDYSHAMSAAAARLDVQVGERQRDGDMAAAQRLVLIAAMVRRSGDEFRNAEQDLMTEPVAKARKPVPARIAAALAKAEEAIASAARDPGFADAAQSTFNALLAALPQKTPHPVMFGMLARDLADAAAPLPADLVVYGYRIVDPELKTQPTVSYAGADLAADAVTVKDDRIEITLPADVKAAVRFEPSPCESRPSFGVRVRGVFPQTHGIWPIAWRSEITTVSDFAALASPVFYAATALTSAESSGATTSSMIRFERRSTLALADCEQTNQVEILMPLPAQARNVKCAASWADASGAAKTSSRCVVEGATARASGDITGGAKVCSPDKLCSCIASAQGWLVASGSYELDQTSAKMTTSAATAPLVFPQGGTARGQIASSAGEKLRHVALSISRRACPTTLDTIDLGVGDDASPRAAGVSKTGAFRAWYEEGTLSVGAAEAIAAQGEETP